MISKGNRRISCNSNLQISAFQDMPFLRFVTIFLCLIAVNGSSTIYNGYGNSFPYSPSIYPYNAGSSRSRRSRLHSSQKYAVAALASRRKKESAVVTKEPETYSSQEMPDVSFDDLGPIGKVVAGTTQVLFTTLLEYCQGFFSGFLLGTVVGVPKFLFTPVNPGVKTLLLAEMKGRFTRMNSKSLHWARSWGGISAAFGGFNCAVAVIRGGKKDDWNQILSSAAAGAFFARSEGSLAMLKGALLYGGMIYLLTGGFSKTRPLHQYTDETVEF